LLRAQIREQPADVAALRMLAEVAARLRRYGDAEVLLRHCVSLAPSFIPARQNLALVLHRQNKPAEALAAIDHCLSVQPGHVSHRNLKAAILGTIGEYEASLQLYREVLNEYPNQAKVWMSFGHALKTAGHDAEGIGAYRQSIKLIPELGEAYWSLANLKTFRFTPQDVSAMRAALNAAELDPHERLHFHFALGKALEDDGKFEESFQHYAEGNRLRRLELRYNADEHHHRLARSHELFYRTISSRALRTRLPRTGSDLHRRSAALGIDAARANPCQPLAGGGHDGTARHHGDRTPPLGRHGRH
jgi:cytochrome c-type biogenesis protein CcmH/NrfG